MEPDARLPVGKTPVPSLVVSMSIGLVLLMLCLRQFALGNAKDALWLLIAGAMFTGWQTLLFFFCKAREQCPRATALRRYTAQTPWLVRGVHARGEIAHEEKHPPYKIGGVATTVFGAVCMPRGCQTSATLAS